ncbi:MAG: SpoIVB peptidase [Syntrophomonadales bacterium]
MSRENIRKLIGVILALLLFAISLTPPMRQVLSLPKSTRLVVGEQMMVSLSLPTPVLDKLWVSVGDPLSSAPQAVVVNREDDGYQLKALKPGQVDVTVKLWGFIPLKSIRVESLPPYQLLAGGHSIGIMLQSQGIMVVGFAPITGSQGQKTFPAREAGIEVGDLIMEVGGQPVHTELELANLIDEQGQKGLKPRLLIRRGDQQQNLTIDTGYCAETGRYRVGLYVRDGVAGVGTLTAWDPKTYRFAALGHVIVDSDTRQVVKIREGRIVSASVQAIQPGRPGQPGEKIGVFDREGMVSGRIEENTYYGVFGVTDRKLENNLLPDYLPVAYAHQVRKGPAQILTVINDGQIEAFDIMIEKVYPFRQNGKGMVLKVIDERLLSVSGGIVQGMSGSPIIQDGRIAGAVTHVFLNDPEKGYGIFMDTLLEEMNLRDGQVFSRQIAR